jgi:3-methyladenine DNA glycosylase Tag
MFEKQPWMQRAGEYPQTDQEYFALLARAVFSAGLGPKVVESRWKEMGEAFHGFDPTQVRLMDEQDVARLLSDPGVIRNRRKIEAVIKNAGTFLQQLADHAAADGVPADSAHADSAAAGASAATAANGHAPFHRYLVDLGAGTDLDLAADALAQEFTHLGRTSALFFLFSAGWRPRETTDLIPSQAAAAKSAADGPRRRSRARP